jgi:anti-sigma factor RsiW
MMTHEEARERLDDFAGGELAEAGHARVRGHLAGCAECRAEVASLRALLDEARFLPREIAPGRDLWAGIAARLEPRAPAVSETPRAVEEAADPKVIPFRRRSGWQPPRWLMAAAAGVVLMIGTSVTTLMVAGPGVRGGGPDRLAPVAAVPPGSAPATTALVAFAPAEAGYRAAIDDLAAVLETRRATLAPETVATLERNLAIIDQAIAESRAALEKDPGSRELAQMLSAVYDTKVRMLQTAVEL